MPEYLNWITNSSLLNRPKTRVKTRYGLVYQVQSLVLCIWFCSLLEKYTTIIISDCKLDIFSGLQYILDFVKIILKLFKIISHLHSTLPGETVWWTMVGHDADVGSLSTEHWLLWSPSLACVSAGLQCQQPVASHHRRHPAPLLWSQDWHWVLTRTHDQWIMVSIHSLLSPHLRVDYADVRVSSIDHRCLTDAVWLIILQTLLLHQSWSRDVKWSLLETFTKSNRSNKN